MLAYWHGVTAAALGAGAARLLSHPAWLRAFNVAMAMLLVASMVPVILEE
jgi:threonine/homoserine/homoserine lactone efflux protein